MCWWFLSTAQIRVGSLQHLPEGQREGERRRGEEREAQRWQRGREKTWAPRGAADPRARFSRDNGMRWSLPWPKAIESDGNIEDGDSRISLFCSGFAPYTIPYRCGEFRLLLEMALQLFIMLRNGGSKYRSDSKKIPMTQFLPPGSCGLSVQRLVKWIELM